jgi:hypothetical protein
MGISLFYFLQWESTKIFATLAILYFFCAENPFKTDRKKYNITKVANILVQADFFDWSPPKFSKYKIPC